MDDDKDYTDLDRVIGNIVDNTLFIKQSELLSRLKEYPEYTTYEIISRIQHLVKSKAIQEIEYVVPGRVNTLHSLLISSEIILK
jgi:hypothetical protein